MTYIDPSKSYGLSDYIAMTPAPEGAAKYPSAITIFCDECGIQNTGDYVVNDTMAAADRYQVARDHLNAERDWICDDVADLCPRCKKGGDL
jgi:hypothetical protein